MTRNEYLVVWIGDDDKALLAEDEFEVFGQRIDAETGAQVGQDDFRISDMGPDGDPGYQAFSPTFITYNSENYEIMVVWRGDEGIGVLIDEEFEIFGQRLATIEKILLNEVVINPTAGEYIEIFNPGSTTTSLENYYLTDATNPATSDYYYNIVTGGNAGGGSSSDFHARFPAGATIGPGEYQTLAISGSDNFFSAYLQMPTYELFEDGAVDGIPDMREALPGLINNQGELDDDGEVVILYFWNGLSDLVMDIDYFLWGDKMEAVDKTGILIDGPDSNSSLSSYQNDTAISSQEAHESHPDGFGFSRTDLLERTQSMPPGGSGIGNRDETSELILTSWSVQPITPNNPNNNIKDPVQTTARLWHYYE